MKALRSQIDKLKVNFEKGGKYEKWMPVFESFETFLFMPTHTTPSKGAHVRDYNDLKRTMILVVVALIPALLFGMYNVGYQHFLAVNETVSFGQTFFYGFFRVLPLVIVSYAVGLTVEFIFGMKKGHSLHEGFLVTGMLIPLIVPIDVPLWQVAVATVFAVIFAKEVFGGTGMNVFNVALVTRAFLFFAYPSKMSGDLIWIRAAEKGAPFVDGFSGATPLAQAAAATDKVSIVNGVGDPVSAFEMFLGLIPGSIGETSTLAILLGAVILIFTGVASWKVMISVFGGGLLTGLLLNAVGANPFMQMPAYYHLIMGGFAFGAVFMATDPVTAARTERGKWIYGFLIGVLAVLFRVVNPAYPEGMMLAILLMNAFAPLIDYMIVQGNIKRREKRAASAA